MNRDLRVCVVVQDASTSDERIKIGKGDFAITVKFVSEIFSGLNDSQHIHMQCVFGKLRCCFGSFRTGRLYGFRLRYSPVSNIGDRRMAEKCLHQGWVIGNILQLRSHSALQIFARLQR